VTIRSVDKNGLQEDGLQESYSLLVPAPITLGKDVLQIILSVSQIIVCSDLNSPGYSFEKQAQYNEPFEYQAINDSEGLSEFGIAKVKEQVELMNVRSFMPVDCLAWNYHRRAQKAREREKAMRPFLARTSLSINVMNRGDEEDADISEQPDLQSIVENEGKALNLKYHWYIARLLEGNREILNAMLGSRIDISVGSAFHPIVALCPTALTFDHKVKWFRHRAQELRTSTKIPLRVHRDTVFQDSFEKIRLLNADQIRGKFVVSFGGEEGEDAGGVGREWLQMLSKELFNPHYGLFIREGEKSEFNVPNAISGEINKQHLEYYRFIGRLFGKCLLDGNYLDAFFQDSSTQLWSEDRLPVMNWNYVTLIFTKI